MIKHVTHRTTVDDSRAVNGRSRIWLSGGHCGNFWAYSSLKKKNTSNFSDKIKIQQFDDATWIAGASTCLDQTPQDRNPVLEKFSYTFRVTPKEHLQGSANKKCPITPLLSFLFGSGGKMYIHQSLGGCSIDYVIINETNGFYIWWR